MNKNNVNQFTLHQAGDALNEGECSSRELVADLIRVIRARDTSIEAYLHLDEEEALRMADATDERRRHGEKGQLLGVPIAIKDAINVAGQPCSCGSRILANYRAPYDATAIARLRAAGAVLLGRTNMDEFAMGSSTENSAFHITRNPWNLECVPGGSSGGSAAAVAADEAIAALGSDSGGSVRQPAAFCGCVGLKPSYGRVSRYGLTAFASSLDQIGPITKDVRDAALLLGAIAGHDPMDSTSLPMPVPNYESSLQRDLQGITAGLPREYFIEGMDPAVEQTIQEAIRHCERLGIKVVDVSLPMTPHAVAVYYIVACAEASANMARFDGVRYGLRAPNVSDPQEMYRKTRASGFGAEVKRRIILGTYVLSSGYYDAYYLRAQQARTLIRVDFERAFQACDVLLAPVTPSAAYRLDAIIADPLRMYQGDLFTIPASLAGACAISVPCGFTPDRMPVGLQVIAPAFHEEQIFRVAYAYEQDSEWQRQKPALP